VKFIGELFKLKLLSERIIQECIKILFASVGNARTDKETMEHHCELVCKLMSTIGKLIDTPQAKPFMHQYFDSFTKLSQDEAISARIRFMFKDLVELRRSNWVPRREENTPKTIGEVSAEALAKQLQDEIDLTETKVPLVPEIKVQKQSQIVDKNVGTTKRKQKKSKSKPKKEATKITEEELEKRTNLLLEEYLVSGDVKEAEQCIKDLNAPDYHAKIIEQAITLTLEKTNQIERDSMSKLFGELSPEVFSEQDFLKAFKSLSDIIDDLEIDIPNAIIMLGNFVGRAVVDNCLSFSLAEKEIKKETVKEVMMKMIHTK